MGRIVIRKRRGDPGDGSGNPGGIVEPAQPYVGNLALPGNTVTGEPDRDDIAAASDDNEPDNTGAGNNPRDTPQYVDPASATDPATGTPKRRGRPRGSSNRNPKRTTATQATADISSILLTLHFGMSKIFKDDIWMITEPESQEMSKAITRVTELYDIQIIPEKQMAWLNLAMVGASVYGPRIAASGKKKKGPHIVEGNFGAPVSM
jgi:hypothetical protein